MRSRTLLPFLLSLLLAACSDSDSPSKPDGGDPGTGGASGSGGKSGTGGNQQTGGKSGTGGSQQAGGNPGTGGKSTGGAPGSGGSTGGGDGGPVDSTPITERTSKDTFACKVERGRTVHTPRNWGVGGHDLVATTGGDAFLARLESTGPTPFQQGPVKFLVGELGVDGAFGATVEPSTAPVDTLSAPALAPRGDGFALVWVEGTSLRFAAFDASGAVVVPSKPVPSGPVDMLSDPHIVRAGGADFGVVYASATGADEHGEVRFLVLDGDGAAKGSSKLVHSLTNKNYPPATTIAADGDGWAIAFRDVQNDRGHVYFTARDASGSERVAPRRLSVIDEENVSSGVGSGFDFSGISLLRSGNRFLAAWTETRRSADFMSDASSIIRVARVTGDGALEQDPVAVRDVEVDVDEVEPSLHAFGDAVALLWARGTHIYICAGCMPDHRIDLLLIDPETLDPLSTVVSMAKRTEPGGGLLARATAVTGQNVLMAFYQQYHVSADPASGAFSCAPK